MTLSDHYFSPAQLEELSSIQSSAEKLKFYSSICTILGEFYVFYEYYIDESRANGAVACIRCGLEFLSEKKKVLCPACERKREQFLSICPQCNSLGELHPIRCLKCKLEFSSLDRWSVATPRSLAQDLAITTDKLASRHIISPRNPKITDRYLALSQEDQEKAIDQIRLFFTYMGLQRLHAVSATSGIYDSIQEEVLNMCNEEQAWGATKFLRPADGYSAKFEEYQRIARSRASTAFALGAFLAGEWFCGSHDLDVGIEIASILPALVQSLDNLIPAPLSKPPTYRDALQTPH